jgi:cytochrome b involved in lipid metabolism
MDSQDSVAIQKKSVSDTEKSYKLVFVLLLFILVFGSYLAYLLYTSSKINSENSDLNNSKSSTESSASINTIAMNENTYTQSQVAEKNSKESCWTIIDENVYNITSYIPNHPGGEKEILQICGKDGSQLFAKPMEHQEGGASNVLKGFKIGTLTK